MSARGISVCPTWGNSVDSRATLAAKRTMARLHDSERYGLSDSEKWDLKMKSAPRIYDKPGCYIIVVKVINIFGNDDMTLVPITVG